MPAFRRLFVRSSFAAASTILWSARLTAAPIPVPGTMTYTQNFNSLGTASLIWVDDSTLPGWFAQIFNGFTPAGTVQASNGTVGGLAGLLNLGTVNDPDRALGSKAASAGNSANIAYAVQFWNSGTAPVRVSRIIYTGELWRTNSSSGGRALREIQGS